MTNSSSAVAATARVGTEKPQPFLEMALYAASLALAMSVWFISIRAPLWLDETSSYWETAGGFWQIHARQGVLFAAHAYILWAFSQVLGTSEIALRVPEILAMCGAVYLLYRAARELFGHDIAMITAVIFCLHPIVVFAAIDVRPYAFAALAINASIFCLVRLRTSDSNWLAALFGFCAACILYFQLLFSVILLPLALGFVILKWSHQKVLWRQLGIATATFAIAMVPVVSRFRVMFRTGHTYNFAERPHFSSLLLTIAPIWLLLIYAVFLIVSSVTGSGVKGSPKDWRIVLALLLGLFPIAVLYGLTAGTSMQVFVERYRLVAIPGLALCWGFLVSVLEPCRLRLLFCMVLVAFTSYMFFTSPEVRHHGYTWKYALEVAEKNAAPDNAPVLICSDFPQSDFTPMPNEADVKNSSLFTTLSYYKLSVPVVGLPRGLNDEAIRDGNQFLQSATHRRFLALGFWPSLPTLQWLTQAASATHTVRALGKFDNITILEFSPRS